MASQKVYTTSDVALTSKWSKNGATVISRATTSTDVREIDVNTLPRYATVIRAVLTVKMIGTAAYGTNYSVCTVNGNTVNSNPNEYVTNSMRLEVLGNRKVTLTFVYQANDQVGTQEGEHNYSYTASFEDITLTVEYEIGEDAGYVDNEILVPAKGVHLYAPKTVNFNANGIVLQPSSCIVTEEAAGTYELEMEHPMDKEQRWANILEDWIIKAPVPPFKIPEVTMPPGKVYRVKSTVNTTPLFSQLPYYTRTEAKISQWNNHTEYHSGNHVWDYYNGVQTIFVSGGMNFGADNRPGDGTGLWALVGPLTPSSVDPGGGTGVYNPGVIIRDIPGETGGNPTLVTFLATYDWKYIKIRDNLGNVGYGVKDDYEETTTSAEPIVIPARTVYTQLFRVYSVACDEASGTVTVNARHISYDYEGNAIFDCKLTEAEPATAIALLQGRLMNNDERLIACPIEAPKISADWSFMNPIQALLDPDEGFAAQLQGMVLRDNADFFILPDRPARIGARLAYGVNLRGVTWERNLDELITRIIPRAGDGEGGFIYLDELFVDSEGINDYAVIHTEVLDSEYAVGQEIELADGTKRTLSKSEVIERMRQEAENRYYVDGCDKVIVSLDVEFVLLGDTEEFRQYRNLQRVNLYDKIVIDTGSMTTSAQVSGYEWDCLMGRYNSVSIGKVYSMGRKRLPGYRVATGAITYSKLAPGLIKWIRGAS